jgi:hypothetical protein
MVEYERRFARRVPRARCGERQRAEINIEYRKFSLATLLPRAGAGIPRKSR